MAAGGNRSPEASRYLRNAMRVTTHPVLHPSEKQAQIDGMWEQWILPGVPPRRAMSPSA